MDRKSIDISGYDWDTQRGQYPGYDWEALASARQSYDTARQAQAELERRTSEARTYAQKREDLAKHFATTILTSGLLLEAEELAREAFAYADAFMART